MIGADFDKAAKKYDNTFTNSSIGRSQRDQVWKYLQKKIKSHSNKILELNCGTGEDAVFLSKYSSNLVATDRSLKMLDVAKEKTKKLNIS